MLQSPLTTHACALDAAARSGQGLSHVGAAVGLKLPMAEAICDMRPRSWRRREGRQLPACERGCAAEHSTASHRHRHSRRRHRRVWRRRKQTRGTTARQRIIGRWAVEAFGARSQAGFVLRLTKKGRRRRRRRASSLLKGKVAFASAKDGDSSNLCGA